MQVWSWSGFFQYLVSPYLLVGALTTLWLTAAALLFGLALGVALALMRLSRTPWLERCAWFYTWLFRGTPLLVQLIVIYTGLPQLGIRFGVVTCALLGLGLNEGAYFAEIIRAGILAVPKGQYEAATALGLRYRTTMRLVVLPQAARIIIPPVGNSVNGLLKTTSLTSVISMEELLRRSQELIQVNFQVLEIFTVAALYYLLMTTLWDLVQRRLEQRFGRAFTAGGASQAQDRS